MDSRFLPYLIALGWLLVTLGIAGAVGIERWWIWPLSVGIGFLALGGAYGWAAWMTVRVAARKNARGPSLYREPVARAPEARG